MKLGIIGKGAIGTYVREHLLDRGFEVLALLVRSSTINNHPTRIDGILCVDSFADLPGEIDHMIDCAGHSALESYGGKILSSGMDLTTVSLGALANEGLYTRLREAAREGQSTLHLASGAIGALDCLRAAKVGGLESVTYIGRKPPKSWAGSPAETRLDLNNLKQGDHIHFSGSARTAAIEYPKNANVAAAVALAGIGFDDTQVKLVADCSVTQNIHQIEAQGEFGNFSFEIKGRSLPDNPKSSALAAMSVISSLAEQTRRIVFD